MDRRQHRRSRLNRQRAPSPERDYPALSISPSVELDSTVVPRPFVALVWYDRLDPTRSKPVPHTRNTVPFVGGQFLRATARTPQALGNGDAVHHRLNLRRFVDLPSRHFDRQRGSVAVSNQVEFRSKPASAAAQSVVGWFVRMPVETFFPAPPAARAARTLAPSMHQRSQSIKPSRSSVICRASMISAKTPSRRHFAKWWYIVCQGPNRSGRSRHGAPVCRIQKIPFNRMRRSRGGRPVRARRALRQLRSVLL